METEHACASHAIRPSPIWKKPPSRPHDWTTTDEILLNRQGWVKASPRTLPFRLGTTLSRDRFHLFNQMKAQWERETANVSSVSQLILNDAYQRIVGMGPSVLPMIFSALKEECGFWFPALKSITGEDPVQEYERGDMEAMRASWLNWAARHGYLRS
jgi:hypothetical protein